MWEDNNPLSYDRRDSESTEEHERPSLSSSPYANDHSDINRPSSPDSTTSNEPPDFASKSDDGQEDEEAEETGRKQGGYDSRIEQMLWENKDLEIYITNAGKNNEGGGGYIVYTIRIAVCTQYCKLD